ncbi:MAG: hypothetical protein J5590_05870 [Clostridia bacterium]|nr:hypothetical protein [Clostridia bacterium]
MKITRILLAITVILFLLLTLVSIVFLYNIHTNKPNIKIYQNIKISTTKEAYAYANDYAKRNLGDKYELHSIEGSHDKDFEGEIIFIYTKRVKHFPDVYFVIVDTANNEIRYKYQTNANRLYGSDLHIDIENWNFDIVKAMDMAQELNIDYDRLEWHTVYEDKIAVFFVKDGVKIDQLDFNTFTGERIIAGQ